MEKFLNSLTYQQIYPIIINANLLETADLEYFKEFYNTSVYNSRKNKSNMLKAKGQIYTFLPDEERYSAMTLSLAKKLKIPTKKARKILEKNNFNYRKVIDEEYY